MKSGLIGAITLLSLLGTATAALAGNGPVYYVSPDGNDNWPGTKEAPWQTLAKASLVRPGDTVAFLPGEYEGILKPLHSGTFEAPITFRAVERLEAKLVGWSQLEPGEYRHAVQLVNVSHVNIEGFHMQPQEPDVGRWVVISNSGHIRVSDCLMEGTAGSSWGDTTPMLIEKATQIQMRDNVIRHHADDNMINVYTSHHLLFEGNAIGYAGHSPLAFSPGLGIDRWGSNSHIAIRGNVFFAGWGRALEFFSDARVLFEGNIITHAYHGGLSADSDAKLMLNEGISRFNRVFRNWGSPLTISTYDPDLHARDMRVYNEVFDDNYMQGLSIGSGDTTRNVIVKNSVFSRNDTYGAGRQVLFAGNADTFKFVGNAIDGLLDGRTGVPLDVTSVQSDAWCEAHGDQFSSNFRVDPGFMGPDRYNHALLPTSSLRGAGQHLTYALGTGEGRILPVDDALYFYDGFGIDDELGDLIAVGHPRQTARVVTVNLADNTLVLDRPVRWKEGDAVSLPWSGKGPDIGAYEHGSEGRISVQVDAEPFVLRPGEKVHLSAIVHGAFDPVEYRWQLGDGSVAYGKDVTHEYEASESAPNSPYGFPIIVRVTDAGGQSYVGTGFVEIESPQRLDLPLFHTTFDADDKDWWWIWYKARPTPVEWERVVDPVSGGNGSLRVSNPGLGSLPLNTYPAGWDIDRYPIVYIRYRVHPETPVALYLQAFSTIKSSRRAYVAVSPAVMPGQVAGRVADYALIDDGKWHDLFFDARLIRRMYPDVEVLYRLGMEAPRNTAARTGTSYWLDEAAVLGEALLMEPAWACKLNSRQTWHPVVRSPQKGQILSGKVPLDVGIVEYADVALREFSVQIGGQTVYSGKEAPPARSCDIDTYGLEDGKHDLVVKATDEAGRSISQVTSLIVRNWVKLADHLEPPMESAFFGVWDRSMTAHESAGWEYATTPVKLFEDTGRKVRKADTPGYLVWHTPSLRQFTVTVYARGGGVADSVDVAVSADGEQWLRVPYSTEVVESSSDGWRKLVLSGRGPGNAETKRFRLTVHDYDPAEDLQIGQVVFDVRR